MPSERRGELTVLIAAAAVLGVADSMIPKPLPFIRLGLANIPSVITVIRFGWMKTLELNTARVLAVALLTGAIGTPTFILSFAGAVASASVMAAVQRFFKGKVSTAGLSVSGAVGSLWVQLLASGFVLHDIPLRSILPVLSLWGVVSGLLVGILAETVSLKLFTGEALRRAEG